MSYSDTTKHTVTANEQFVDELCECYPAATSVPQAFVMAAQDGVTFRQSFNSDLEHYIRLTVKEATREELADKPD